MPGLANDLNISQPGIVVHNGSGVFTGVTLTAGTGVTITNGSGIAGNPVISVAGGGVAVEHLTGNTGGQLNPDGSNNFNLLGTGSVTVAGSGSTLTTQLTGLTNHALQIGAGTATLTQLGAGTTGQVLQTNTGADPTWSTATYPSTAGTSGNILQSNGTNFVSTSPVILLSTNVTLTSAQIKALHGTPIQIIATPSAGQMIVITSMASKYTYGGNNVFVAAASQTISLFYSNLTSVAQNGVVTNAELTGTSTKWHNGLNSSSISTATDITALGIVAYNSVATEITGNANNDNTFEITVLYYIWTL